MVRTLLKSGDNRMKSAEFLSKPVDGRKNIADTWTTSRRWTSLTPHPGIRGTGARARGARRESQSSGIPTPRFHQGVATLHKSYWRNPFSQWYDWLPESSDLGNASWKIPGPGKSTSRLKNVQNQQFFTMHWIKEVEMAKSMDDLLTSQSITGRTDFLDYDVLDAMIASVLKKIISDQHFAKE